MELPAGKDGWAILTDAPLVAPSRSQLEGWRDATLADWREIASQVTYRGTVRQVADFLAANWREPDYGIWEEHAARHYTVGKVIVSCGLRYIADFADDASQARR